MQVPTQVDAQSVIRRELGPQERLLWAGQPRQGLVLRPVDIFMIPFSLLWAGFAFFWEFMAVRGGAPWFFALWGIPFMVVGCYVVFGRFIVDMRQRAKTVYGFTNERILIISGVLTRNVKSLNLQTLSDVSLSERPDGSGTITFGQGAPYSAWFQGMGWWPGVPPSAPAFDQIPRAKEIYEAIRGAQRTAT